MAFCQPWAALCWVFLDPCEAQGVRPQRLSASSTQLAVEASSIPWERDRKGQSSARDTLLLTVTCLSACHLSISLLLPSPSSLTPPSSSSLASLLCGIFMVC